MFNGWNWFTIGALISAFAVVTLGTVLVIVLPVTMDHIAGIMVIGIVGIISAVLSLHFQDKQ